MGKLVIFSDPHYQLSKLKEQLDVTNYIFNFATEIKADAVIINGDIFEEKNRVDVRVYNPVWELFNNIFLQDQFLIYVNSGNHDLFSTQESLLKPFEKVVTGIITHTVDLYIKEYLVRFVPYGGFLEQPNPILVSQTKILFVHELIDCFTPEIYNEPPLAASSLSKWDIVCNGHIHKPAEYKNIWNIGSPLQLNFSEEGEQKRFLFIDGDAVKSIPLGGPQYITIDGLSDVVVEKLKNNKYDHIRINVSPELITHKIFKQDNIKPNIIKNSEMKKNRINNTSSISDILSSYVEQTKTDLDKNNLLEIINKKLGEIQ